MPNRSQIIKYFEIFNFGHTVGNRELRIISNTENIFISSIRCWRGPSISIPILYGCIYIMDRHGWSILFGCFHFLNTFRVFSDPLSHISLLTHPKIAFPKTLTRSQVFSCPKCAPHLESCKWRKAPLRNYSGNTKKGLFYGIPP